MQRLFPSSLPREGGKKKERERKQHTWPLRVLSFLIGQETSPPPPPPPSLPLLLSSVVANEMKECSLGRGGERDGAGKQARGAGDTKKGRDALTALCNESNESKS